MKDVVFYHIDRIRNATEIAIDLLIALSLAGLSALTYYGDTTYRASEVRYLILVPILFAGVLYWIEHYRSRAELFLIFALYAGYEYVWIRFASKQGYFEWEYLALFATGFWVLMLYNLILEEKKPKPTSEAKPANGEEAVPVKQALPVVAPTLRSVPTQEIEGVSDDPRTWPPPIGAIVNMPDESVDQARELIERASDPHNSNEQMDVLMHLIERGKAAFEQALSEAKVPGYEKYIRGIFVTHSKSSLLDLLREEDGKWRPVVAGLIAPILAASSNPVEGEVEAPDESAEAENLDDLLEKAQDTRNQEGQDASKRLLELILAKPRSDVEEFLGQNRRVDLISRLLDQKDPQGVNFFLRPQTGPKDKRKLDRDQQQRNILALKGFLSQPTIPTIPDQPDFEAVSQVDTQPRLSVPELDPWTLVMRSLTDTTGQCAATLFAIFQSFGLEQSAQLLKNEDLGISEGDAKKALENAQQLRGKLLSHRRFEYQVFEALLRVRTERGL